MKEEHMETTAAVRGREITKCFGDVVALDRVDLDVARGQVHGLVGPNGAGKTTLLGLLLGLAVADEGRLEILGTPVGRALAAPDGIAGFVDGPIPVRVSAVHRPPQADMAVLGVAVTAVGTSGPLIAAAD